MIKVGIVGISGYSGELVLKLLLNHPGVRVTYISANNTTGKVGDILPALKGQTSLFCEKYDLKKALESADVFFLAVPHTVAMQIVPELLKAKKRIIDLSADYRLKSTDEYKKWYDVEHTDTDNLPKAIYGLPELYRRKIAKANLIANPGCYPTSAILALAPIVATKTELINFIIIDAKSGVSGAGKKVVAQMMFSEVNENFKAYKVLKHQHTPEITDHLTKLAQTELDITFVTHLLPINRGILSTVYVHLKSELNLEGVHDIYKKFYKTEKFVRVLGPNVQPEIKNVNYTNYCDIGLASDKKMLVITSVIDNLMKGASGQAVQNMNIMCGFEETQGLR